MDNWFDANETRRRWPFAPERPHPVIFLRELRLLESLNAAEPIQSVKFRTGLNIVWADPKVKEARSGGPRMAGHSAGKTTLCRIIRWLLGEVHFGSDDTEVSVGAAFINGWALLRLELDGKPWVIGRAFSERRDHRAARDVTLDEVQKNGWPEPHAKDEFLAELTRLTIAPLERQRFPGEIEDFRFTDLLGWLSRDQEAALQRVDSWRATTSGNSQPAPDRPNRHILMRLVLQLLEGAEWDEMEKCAKLETEKDGWKKKEPGLEASAKAACEPLARLVGADADSLAGPLIISNAGKLVEAKEGRLKTLKEEIGKMEVKQTQSDLEAAIAALAKGEKAVERAGRDVKRLEKRVSERSAELLNAKAKTLAASRISPGFCAKKREEAEGKCPLYTEVPESFAAAQTAAEIQQQRDHLHETLDENRQELTEAQGRIAFLQANEAQSRKKRDEAVKQCDDLQRQIANLEASLNADSEVLIPAQSRQTAFETCQSELARLSVEIKDSIETQRAIRQARWMDRNVFGDHYRAALQQLTGKGSVAPLQFDPNGLFDLENSGSAANALKVLAFDLGAMLWSASGKSHHPRLLIHDSPRVADMSPVPYAAIFDMVAAAEGDGQGAVNFQYIITTTEEPPKELHSHIVLTLDASQEDGLLFKQKFGK